MAEFEKVIEHSQKFFNDDDLAANVFATKYALCDKDGNYYETSPDDMHRRLSKEFYRVESKYPNPMTENEIYELL
tara:strand:+ start:198 stop:422 length:225 start_codon:yes stop_codon:yes gene_type:complete